MVVTERQRLIHPAQHVCDSFCTFYQIVLSGDEIPLPAMFNFLPASLWDVHILKNDMNRWRVTQMVFKNGSIRHAPGGWQALGLG